jgi:hypothetical protein
MFLRNVSWLSTCYKTLHSRITLCKNLKSYMTVIQMNSLTHGAEPFLRSCHLCSHSRTSAFYRTRRFIAVFKRAVHSSRSWARSIQSKPSYPISLRPFLILSTPYVLVFPVVSFLVAFPPISYMQSSSPAFVLHALPISSSFTWPL